MEGTELDFEVSVINEHGYNLPPTQEEASASKYTFLKRAVPFQI